jgi:hypothetical protein
MPAPAKHAHLVAIAAKDEPEPVVLDLIGPLRAGRRGAADGRQARRDEARRMTGRNGGGPAHEWMNSDREIGRKIGGSQTNVAAQKRPNIEPVFINFAKI